MRPTLHGSCENEGDWQVVRFTNILGTPIPDLLNKDDKLIDIGQIIISQKLQERENDIYVMMVSWGHCVTSEDRYITIVSTVMVTALTYLGFEYRSVHDGDGRGFTVKPTAKYVDECLDIVQLQNAKAVMTPLTEQKSLNLHDETTACDQVQHSLFRAVVGKLQYITGVRQDLMFATKCLSYKLASPTLSDLTRAKKVLRYLKGTLAFDFTDCRCQALSSQWLSQSLVQRSCKICGKGPIGKASGLTWTHRMLCVCAHHPASGMSGKYGPHSELFFFLIKKEPFALTKAVGVQALCSCGDAESMCIDWSAPDGSREHICVKWYPVS